MSDLKLTIACGDYDRTRALADGTVRAAGLDLRVVTLRPAETFWRMLNNEEFDGSEMSLASYAILRAAGDERFVALPVFLSRLFRHSCLYVGARSGIGRPEDLKGKRIGAADYQMTAAVWLRGLLQDEYGVRPEDMAWVLGAPVREGLRLPERLRARSLEPEESLDGLLEAGELDALIGVTFPRAFTDGSGRARRLFPDYRRIEEDYYRRTRVFPIMHTFVLRTAVLRAEPWTALSLYQAFVAAKRVAYERLYDTDALRVGLPWLIDAVENARAIFGPDIWDYSVEGSRPTLETLLRYLYEQGLAARQLRPEDLFAPGIRPGYEPYLRSFYR